MPIVERHWLRWHSRASTLASDASASTGSRWSTSSASNSRSRSGRCAGSRWSGKKWGSRAATIPSSDEPAGVAVVGMEPVALPRVVAEHDVRAGPAGSTSHTRGPLGEPAVELAVDGRRGMRRRPAPRTRGGGRLLSAPGRRPARRRSALGSHVPFEPSVSTSRRTSAPAAAHLASVAPQPNSTSSGWAPIARRPRRRSGSSGGQWPRLAARCEVVGDVDVEGEIGVADDADRRGRGAGPRRRGGGTSPGP